jgi:molybdate transport system substrate-binding protein
MPRLMSTLAIAGLLRAAKPAIEAALGAPVEVDLAPTRALEARIHAGERADAAVLTAEAIAALGAEGVLDAATARPLAHSRVGLAVKAGVAHPDISSVDALRRVLLAVPTLCYSRAGASGIFFAGLIERLGIAAEVNAKAIVIPQGFTAERLVTGEAAIAFQQVSELMEGLYRRRLRAPDAQGRRTSRSRNCMPRSPTARCRMPASPRTTWTAISAPATRRAWGPIHGRLHGPDQAAPCRQHRHRRLLLRDACRPCGAGDREGRCNVALITLAGRPRAEGMATGTAPRAWAPNVPDDQFEIPMAAPSHRPTPWRACGTCTNSARPASSSPGSRSPPRHHAQHNPHAMLRKVVTVEEVVNSPMVADPLHRLDCCVISDGGGALIVARPEIAKSLKRPAGEGARHRRGDQEPGRRRHRPHLLRGAAVRCPRPSRRRA